MAGYSPDVDMFGYMSGRSHQFHYEETKVVTPTKATALSRLKAMIDEVPNSCIKNTDDDFLMRFLYARKMNVEDSFTLLTNYYSYRERNKELFENLSVDDPLIKQALYDGFPGVLSEKDRKGRCVLVFFCSNWDHSNYPLEVVYKSLLLTLESLLTKVEHQVNGFVIIVDWTDISLRQMTSISPRTVRLMVEGLQDCFPARFKGVHFLNQPWYIERLLAIIKNFLKEKTRKKIFVHGNNLSSLHAHVTLSILPSELGGDGPPFSPTPWAHSLTTKYYYYLLYTLKCT